MLVRTETAQQAASTRPALVRVHSGVGSAAVCWQGEPEDVGREHHVEWDVDEDLVWEGNVAPSASASPLLAEDDDRIVLRGRLNLTGYGAAFLELAETQIQFGLADPAPPGGADGMWVEVRVRRESVSLWPYRT